MFGVEVIPKILLPVRFGGGALCLLQLWWSPYRALTGHRSPSAEENTVEVPRTALTIYDSGHESTTNAILERSMKSRGVCEEQRVIVPL